MSRKFTGDLGRNIAPRRIGLLASEAEQERLIAEWVADDFRKLDLLADAYGLDRGDFCGLALALARDFVPAFQEKNPSEPELWSELAQALLVVEIDRRVTKGVREKGVSYACAILSNLEPWKSVVKTKERLDGTTFSDADTARKLALKQAYYAAKRNRKNRWIKVARDALKLHEAENRLDEWKTFVDASVRSGRRP